MLSCLLSSSLFYCFFLISMFCRRYMIDILYLCTCKKKNNLVYCLFWFLPFIFAVSLPGSYLPSPLSFLLCLFLRLLPSKVSSFFGTNRFFLFSLCGCEELRITRPCLFEVLIIRPYSTSSLLRYSILRYFYPIPTFFIPVHQETDPPRSFSRCPDSCIQCAS